MNQEPVIHMVYDQPPTLDVAPRVLVAVGVGSTVLEQIAVPLPPAQTGAHQSGTTIDYSGMTNGRPGDKIDDVIRDE